MRAWKQFEESRWDWDVHRSTQTWGGHGGAGLHLRPPTGTLCKAQIFWLWWSTFQWNNFLLNFVFFFRHCCALFICHSLAPLNKSLRKWDVYVHWRSQSWSYNPHSQTGRAAVAVVVLRMGGCTGVECALWGLAMCHLPSCPVNSPLLSLSCWAHPRNCPLACPHQQMKHWKDREDPPWKAPEQLWGGHRGEGFRHWAGTNCPASSCGFSPRRIWKDFP